MYRINLCWVLTLDLLPSLLKPIEPLEANRPTICRQHETWKVTKDASKVRIYEQLNKTLNKP
jgi:hypothetical protein